MRLLGIAWQNKSFSEKKNAMHLRIINVMNLGNKKSMLLVFKSLPIYLVNDSLQKENKVVGINTIGICRVMRRKKYIPSYAGSSKRFEVHEKDIVRMKVALNSRVFFHALRQDIQIRSQNWPLPFIKFRSGTFLLSR